MAPSFLSLVPLYASFLRRCFVTSGLSSQTLAIDSDTVIHFWGPSRSVRDHDPTVPRKPSLLLLHGFGPSAIWQWRRQVQSLSSLFQLYVPDLVFFGDSTTKSTERSEVFQAVSMAKLMEKLEVESFHIMGTSYGGLIAYHVARMWPQRVDKVVIASSGVNMRKSDNEGLLKRAKFDNIQNVMLPASAAELRTLTGLAVHRRLHMIPDFFLNDIVHKLYSENRKEKMELLKGLTLGTDENVNLSRLSQDVLLIWGDQDQIFPVKMAYELKEILGEKARLELIKNTSHVPQIENSQEFNRIVKDFLCGSS